MDVKLEVRNRVEIPLQHRAIACQSDPLAVVVNSLVNELPEIRPVLFVQAGDVVPVDG